MSDSTNLSFLGQIFNESVDPEITLILIMSEIWFCSSHKADNCNSNNFSILCSTEERKSQKVMTEHVFLGELFL